MDGAIGRFRAVASLAVVVAIHVAVAGRNTRRLEVCSAVGQRLSIVLSIVAKLLPVNALLGFVAVFLLLIELTLPLRSCCASLAVAVDLFCRLFADGRGDFRYSAVAAAPAE